MHRNEHKITHGHARAGRQSSEYMTWGAMLSRCRNPRNKNFARYGGRGITVCERWESFANFLADMGPRPSKKHSLERRDNNVGYNPGNCEWCEGQHKQTANMCRNVHVLVGEERMVLMQAADKIGIPRWKILQRRARGWSIEKAFNGRAREIR